MSEHEPNQLKEMGFYTDVNAYGNSAVLELATWFASILDRFQVKTVAKTQRA